MANKWGEKCKQWQILYSWAPESLEMVTAAMKLKELASWEKSSDKAFVVVQPLSRCCLFATPWSAACQASLSFTISWSLLKLMSIESVMSSNHLILCGPLLLSSIFPSIRVFSNESVLHIRWPKYWSFSFRISPSNEYSGLNSFRLTCLISLQSKILCRRKWQPTPVFLPEKLHGQKSLAAYSHGVTKNQT